MVIVDDLAWSYLSHFPAKGNPGLIWTRPTE
jgi:hypothetical protein